MADLTDEMKEFLNSNSCCHVFADRLFRQHEVAAVFRRREPDGLQNALHMAA